MKTLPLYLGIILVVAAIAGGVSMLLQPPPAPRAPLEPIVDAGSTPAEIAEQKRLAAREVEKKDDADSRRIIYEQVSKTEPDFSDA